MESFSLTPTELKALRQEHKQMAYRTDAYRINAIILLGTGWTQAQVSEALLLDERTIRRYVRAYRQGGIEGLLEVRFQGGQCHLAQEQITRLDNHLQENLYTHVRDVCKYIQTAFGVSYSISGVTQLLKRMGFVYKKPKHVPGKADRNAQQAFIQQYKDLKENKHPDDPIYFADAAHPQHNSVPAYGWIKKGQEAEIKANCGRQRLNINGAIDVASFQVLARFDDTINAQSTINLFKQLERKHRKAKTIYVIADNARYYRSRDVKTYLETSRIKLIFLPAYSPNLNLIERLWKHFRKVVLHNRYYQSFADFTEAAEAFFLNIKEHRNALRSLLTEKFHLFSA
jgi:transposase